MMMIKMMTITPATIATIVPTPGSVSGTGPAVGEIVTTSCADVLMSDGVKTGVDCDVRF